MQRLSFVGKTFSWAEACRNPCVIVYRLSDRCSDCQTCWRSLDTVGWMSCCGWAILHTSPYIRAPVGPLHSAPQVPNRGTNTRHCKLTNRMFTLFRNEYWTAYGTQFTTLTSVFLKSCIRTEKRDLNLRGIVYRHIQHPIYSLTIKKRRRPYPVFEKKRKDKHDIKKQFLWNSCGDLQHKIIKIQYSARRKTCGSLCCNWRTKETATK